MKKTILSVVIASLLLTCQPLMAETEGNAFNEIRTIINNSILQQELKNMLVTRVSEAFNNGIPADDIKIIVQRGIARGINGRIIENLLDAAIKVKKQGLPAVIVLDRIQQGMSKGVPAERMLTAVNRLSENLFFADSIVEGLLKSGVKMEHIREKEDAVIIVARAMEKSLTLTSIEQMGSSVKRHNYPLSMFARTVDAVTVLIENGAGAGQALKLLNKAIERGYSARDIQRLEMKIFRELREGQKIENTLKRIESSMEKGFDQFPMGMGNGPERFTGTGLIKNEKGGSSMSGPGMQHRR